MAARRSLEEGPRSRGSDGGGVCRPVRDRDMLVPFRGRTYRYAAGTAPPCTGHFVGRLDRIVDTLFGVLLVIHNFGSQRALASLCYGLYALARVMCGR